MTSEKRSRAVSIGVAMVLMAATAIGIVKLLGGGAGTSADLDAATVAAAPSKAAPGSTVVNGADGEAYTAYGTLVPGGAQAPGATAAGTDVSVDPANTGAAPVALASPSTRTGGAPALPLTSAQAEARSQTGGGVTVTTPASMGATATTKATTSTTKPAAATTAKPATASTTAATAAATGGLSSVEQQIVQLTNELRTNPNGSLARKGATPSCVSKDGSGQIQAVPALKVNSTVSVGLSRDWSMQMNAANAMSHRPSDASLNFYKGLGLSISTWGENVAWFSGYSDAQAAQVFFEGWRESEGHYCNMMNPAYNSFGVGVYKGASKSWATQNFYGTR